MKRRFHSVVRRMDDREIATPGAFWRHRDLGLLPPVCAVVLLGACLTLFTWRSGPARPLVGAVEIALALGCLARALSNRPGRLVSLALGAGLFAFAVGNIGAHPGRRLRHRQSLPASRCSSTRWPSWHWSCSCAPSRVGSLPTVWLDGVMASLGAAAIGAALALHTILGCSRRDTGFGRGEPGASDRGPHLGGAGPRGGRAGAPASGAHPALRCRVRPPGRR